MKVEEAVKTLTKALKEDEGFWLGYKANIAMAFKDEVQRYLKSDSLFDEAFGDESLHEIANQAADNFLKLWCNQQ